MVNLFSGMEERARRRALRKQEIENRKEERRREAERLKMEEEKRKVEEEEQRRKAEKDRRLKVFFPFLIGDLPITYKQQIVELLLDPLEKTRRD